MHHYPAKYIPKPRKPPWPFRRTLRDSKRYWNNKSRAGATPGTSAWTIIFCAANGSKCLGVGWPDRKKMEHLVRKLHILEARRRDVPSGKKFKNKRKMIGREIRQLNLEIERLRDISTETRKGATEKEKTETYPLLFPRVTDRVRKAL